MTEIAPLLDVWASLPRSTRSLAKGFRHMASMNINQSSHCKMPKEHRKPSVPKQQRNGRRPVAARQLPQRDGTQAEPKMSKQGNIGSAWLGEEALEKISSYLRVLC